MVKKWETFWTKSTVLSLVLGQLLSLLLTSTAFTSSQLANQGIYEPLPLSFLNYILLALIYGGVMLYRRQTSELFAKLDNYEMLAWVDAMANLIMMKVKAYHYTSVTSVMLLDCWTIPCVLLFTWFFLKTKYGFQKLVGVTICVAGLVTFAFSCVHFVDTSGGNNPLKGDICIIVAATLCGVSNVREEFIVKKADRVELMAFFGILGAFYNAILIAVFERNELKSIYSSFSPGAVLPFIGFSLARFLFYSGVPVLLKISGSTMLNLSLLTSDMWVVLIRIFAYHEKVDWMYFVAFAAVTLGLIVYSGGDNKMDPGNGESECKCFDEEANLGQ